MKRCQICNAKFQDGRGLANHRRAQHPKFKGENRIATEEMLAELERQERIESADVALVQMLRSLADQLDCDPSNAQMWRTYRETIETLCGEDHEDDGIDKLLAEINSRAPMGNAKET